MVTTREPIRVDKGVSISLINGDSCVDLYSVSQACIDRYDTNDTPSSRCIDILIYPATYCRRIYRFATHWVGELFNSLKGAVQLFREKGHEHF